MIPPRWRKILRDLWDNKTRTLLVVLSVAVGVFAIGMILTTRIVLSDDLRAAYLRTNPASAILYTEAFDEELVQAARHSRGVAEAEGRRSVGVQLRVAAGQWRTLRLTALDDFEGHRLNRIRPVGGQWPPPLKGLLLERASLSLAGAGTGDTVTVETAGGRFKDLEVAGIVHDLNNPPAVFQGTPYGYVTLDTLEWLGFPRSFDELHLLVAERQQDKEHIQQVADRVKDKIERGGTVVFWTWVPDPGEHPAMDSVMPMITILGALGTLSLLVSGFLVVNTISAILAQQVRQIGVMKAVGARTGQIVQLYLGAVVIFGLLSLLVAVPLGALAAHALTSYLAGLINFDLAGLRLPPSVVLIQVLVGLLVPLLAALAPVVAGARITVREAISDYGLGRGRFGRSRADRLLEQVRGLPRPLLLSLRNTFRRKARLALTLSSLTLAGALLMAVLTVYASLLATLDDTLAYWNYDIEMDLDRNYRIEQVEPRALAVEGVEAVESWLFRTGRRIREDGRQGPNTLLVAPPADSRMIEPRVLEGRWLLPEDENALVVNTKVLDEEPDVRVGDWLRMKIAGRETDWRVVGIVQSSFGSRTAYANYPYMARRFDDVGRVGSLRVVTADHSPAAQQRVAEALEEHLEGLGVRVSSSRTLTELRESITYQFQILVALLSIMAVLLAIVGGLGLAGTMSINVLERAREIGVMRAIGASDRAVLQTFLVEGVLIGLLSWMAGAVVGLPVSRALSDIVGYAFVDAPLTFRFSWPGLGLWLGLVLAISAVASLLPSWRAARLRVQTVLAYE